MYIIYFFVVVALERLDTPVIW